MLPMKNRIVPLKKALVIALGLAAILGISASDIAGAAVQRYCGQIKVFDQWGNPNLQDVAYNATLQKCEVSVLPSGTQSAGEISQLDNFQLPNHVTSIDVAGVGGGGSAAMDTTNWWDFYFSDYNTDNVSYNDSGGGGGGAAGFSRSNFSISPSYRFKMNAGAAGMLDESFTRSGFRNSTAGWFGSDGGNTIFGYSTDGGTSFTTITAGGGKAPSGLASNGGAGGSVSGTTSGWSYSGGSAGLARSSNNGGNWGGYYLNGFDGLLGQGGGAAAYGGWPTGKGAGLGSGAAAAYVDSGAYFYEDIPCMMNQYRGACDGQPGAVRLTYAAVDYVPAYLNYNPGLYSNSPKVGDVLDLASALSVGSNVEPTPTQSYVWYRCTGAVAYNDNSTSQASGCTAISGATAGTYTIQSADLGYRIQAKVTLANSGQFSNSGGASSTSVSYFTETTGDFVVTTPGAPTVGTTPTSKTPTTAKVTLTPSTSWGSSYSFTVVNSSDGATVGTATYDGSTYLNIAGLTANTAYSLKVKQNNSAGSSVASTATLAFSTPLAVTNNGTPTLTADPRQTKTASYTRISSWAGNTTPTVTHSWYYCTSAKTAAYQSEGSITTLTSGCTATGAVNAATLYISAGNLGKYLTVIETAVDSFSTSYYRSESTTIITGEMDAPTITATNIAYWYRVSFTYTLAAFTGSSAYQTHNKMRWSSDGGATWVTGAEVNTSSLGYQVNTFSGGTTYLAQVAVKNSSGTYSAWSQSVTLTTPRQISVTTFPTLTGGGTIGNSATLSPGVYSSDGTQTTSSVAWYACPNPLAASSGGSPIVSGCIANTTFNNMTTITPVYANFNTYYHMYAAQLMLDSYGSNIYARTATVQFTTAPDAPTSVVASATSNTAMSVSFTAPVMAGANAIGAYRYSIAAGPSYSSWSTPTLTGAGTATTFNITSGLVGGTSYKVRLTASNSYATSLASAESAAVQMPAAPSITGSPTISGTVAVGSTLTASTSATTVTGDPTPVTTFSWYACGSTSDATTLTGTCSAITNETTDTLAITANESMKYLVFRMVATNAYGSAIAKSAATILVPGVPGAPTGVSASALNTTSLQVTYSLPTDIGGGALTRIEYQYAAAPYSSWSSFTAAADMSGTFNITGLISNTSYQVVVRAVNAIGNGTSSTASTAVATLGAPVVANAPTINANSYVGQVVTATEPGGMFTGNPTPTISARAWYACPTSKTAGASLAGCSAISGATSTTFTITSAQLGTYLVFAATGTNGSGSAVASSASSAIIATVPAAPTISTIALNGSGSASVTVVAGAANNAAITRYEYELNASGSWIPSGSAATTFNVGSLTNGVQYALRVRAINAVGSSLASASSNLTTLAAATGGSAASGSAVLNLSWTAVAGATGYSVTYSTSSSTGFVQATGACSAPTTTNCALSGLTVGSAYYFKVTALNGSGSAPASAAFGPTTVLQIASVTGTPTLSGAFSIGSTITASESGLTISGYATPTLTRSWFACSTVGDASTLSGSCSAISGASSTSYTVTSAESRKYLVYRVTATNTLGSATVRSATTQMIAGVPDVISTLTAATSSTTSITVSYTAPSDDGGSALTAVQYKFAAAPYSAWSSWSTVALSNTSFNISGLTPNTSYQVIMRAVNAIGTSADSAASSPVTTYGIPTVANVPTLSGAARVGQLITATEPAGMFAGTPAPLVASRGWYACPTSRFAGASLGDCDVITGATSTSLTLTSAQLGKYVAYSATGQNLTGIVDAVSASTAIVASVPNAPFINSISLNGSGSAAFTITPGAANFATISDVQYELNASGTWVSTGSTSSTFTISALTNGASTPVRVRTVNSVGNSAASVSATVTPLAGATGGVAGRGDGQLALSWSAVAGATGYQVTYSTSLASGYQLAAGACAALSGTNCILTGLTNGTPYYFKVTATNSNGNAPASAAFGPTTPLSQNANLAALVVRAKTASGASAIGAALNTAFASATYAYSADVTAANQYVTITPTQAIAGQVIKVNGTTVSSGSQSTDISIGYGANTVTIQVLSPDKVFDSGSTAVATYTLTVNRLNPDMTSFTAFSGSSTAASPVTSTFTSVGITGVTNSNVAAVNSALAALPAASLDSPAELQQVVTSYVSVLAQAGGGTPSTPPTAAEYAAIGVSAAQSFSAPQVTYLNAVIRSLPTSAVADVANVQVVAESISNLYAVAAGSSAAPITVAQLAALGVTGVTSANLADIVAALVATADDGSGINTVAEVQALVDSVKAASVNAIVSGTAISSVTAPTQAAFAAAGVTGVTGSNVSTLNAILAALPNGSKDSTVEIQTVVNSLSLVLAQASRVGSVGATPVASNYAALGAATAAALSTSGISLLNNLLTYKSTSAFDSPAELNALAASVSIIQTSVNSATLDDFASLGLRGVTSSNLTTIQALVSAASLGEKDSLGEIQLLIDKAATVEATTSFANAVAGAPSVMAPTVQNFVALGVTGVSGSNVSALNAAIRLAAGSANPAGSWLASPVAIQALVDALTSAPIASISSYSGSGAAPTLTDFQSLGVVGLKAATLPAVNAYIAALPQSATDSSAEVQSVVTAYSTLVTAIESNTPSKLSVASLQALGVTGVTSANLPAIARAILAAGAAGVDTLTEIQSIVTTSISTVADSVSDVVSYAVNPAIAPALSVYTAAGLVGVSTTNKALVDAALASASPSPVNLTEIQAIIDEVISAPVSQIANFASPAADIRVADFALAGISGVTNVNRAAVVAVLANLPSTSRDSVAEIQTAIESYALIQSIARGAANVAPEAPKPSVADFLAIGVDLGVLAVDPQAFEFFVSIVSKLPVDVVSSPAALSERAAIVASLMRIASGNQSLAEVGPEQFAAIGVTGVTPTNIGTVLAEIATGTGGIAGLDSVQAAMNKYELPAVARVIPRENPVTPNPPTPTPQPEDPTPTPTPTPSVSVPAPAKLTFPAGSTALTAAAKAVVESQVVKLVKSKVKTVIIQAVVTLPKNSSKAWSNQVLAAGKSRAAMVAKVVASKIKAMRGSAKVVVKVSTTTVQNTRTVKISGTK